MIKVSSSRLRGWALATIIAGAFFFFLALQIEGLIGSVLLAISGALLVLEIVLGVVHGSRSQNDRQTR